MMQTQALMMFYEDVYLYDLNGPGNAPLAYRSARGGLSQPALQDALGISPRTWAECEPKLYQAPLYLAEQGAVVLPVFGRVGRFALVIKTKLSPAAFALLAQEVTAGVTPKVRPRERAALDSAVHTVAALTLLIRSCDLANDAFAADECIQLACSLFGVTLASPESIPLPALQGQEALPQMQVCGQALLVSILTLVSLMRNVSHARSGWLYAKPIDGAFVLHAALRYDADAELSAISRLNALLEQGGAMLGERLLVPGKQTRPRGALCMRCGCVHASCAKCATLQWVMMPYVCDVALLGIKNYFDFEA